MKHLAPIAIVFYCALQAHNLLFDWGASPFMRQGYLAFALWGLPLFYCWIKKPFHPNIPLLIGALFVSLSGTLSSLNTLTHLGFALALLATTSSSWLTFFWLATAIAWLPATAYFAKPLAPHLVTVLRLIIATIGGAIGFKQIAERRKFR